MGKHYIFKIGGAFFVIGGAFGLFFWLVSSLGGFETSMIPTFISLGALGGIDILKAILVLFGSLFIFVGLILAGLIFVKIPEVVAGGDIDEVDEKINRLQTVVWKVLEHMRRSKEK